VKVRAICFVFFYISDLIWFRFTIDCGIQWYFIFTIDYVLFNHHIYDEKIFKKYIIQIKNYNGPMDECSIVTYKR